MSNSAAMDNWSQIAFCACLVSEYFWLSKSLSQGHSKMLRKKKMDTTLCIRPKRTDKPMRLPTRTCWGFADAVCRSSATGIIVMSLKRAKRTTYVGLRLNSKA